MAIDLNNNPWDKARRNPKPVPVSGLQSYDYGDITVKFVEIAKEIVSKSFHDETKEKQTKIIQEVVDDFERKRKRGWIKFPGPTFRLAILAAHNGRCQMCGQARLHMYTSDAGEKLCNTCVTELEEEINLGIKVRPPREPEGGTDWLKEDT